jgi:hypothetical protein
MRDCPNADIRDQLPDLLHERLDEGTRVVVLAHIAECGDCTEELSLLRALREATLLAPHVDIARIAAAIPPAQRPRLATIPARTWRNWGAGATLALAAGLGAVMVARDGGTSSTMEVGGISAPNAPAAERSDSLAAIIRGAAGSTSAEDLPDGSGAPVSRELAVALDLSDVSDGELVALLEEIEGLDALPSGDPEEPLPTPARGEEGEGER